MTSEAFDAMVTMLAATNLAGETTVEERRAAIDVLGTMLGSAPGTATEDVEAGGVPARWVRPDTPRSATGDTAVLWLHGGGYNIGSLESHTPTASHLAAALGAPVLIAGYRLAPEHPHPAAIDDASAVWAWLVARGHDPAALAVVGDSAGGGLALALAMRLRDAGAAGPAALALLCPWVDLAGRTAISPTRAAADVVLSGELLATWAATYAGATPLDDTVLSPLWGNLTDLPPMLVHAAGRDILCDQALHLAADAAAAGASLEIEVAEEMIHAWHLFAGAFPEAGESLARVAAWLTPHLCPA